MKAQRFADAINVSRKELRKLVLNGCVHYRRSPLGHLRFDENEVGRFLTKGPLSVRPASPESLMSKYELAKAKAKVG